MASSRNRAGRLERCWQIIGNWPQFWKNGLEANKKAKLSVKEYQTRLESCALLVLCPPLREITDVNQHQDSRARGPHTVEQMIPLAIALMQQGRPEESLPLWSQVTKEMPANADYFSYYGIALRDAGKRSAAMEAFRKAFDVAPGSVLPNIEIARTYMQQGLADLAMHHLEGLAPAVRDQSAELLCLLGELYFGNGRFTGANTEVQKAIKLDPDNADAHNLAARGLLRMPQSRENRQLAAAHAKKAAAAGRPVGLEEWDGTKRHRRD